MKFIILLISILIILDIYVYKNFKNSFNISGNTFLYLYIISILILIVGASLYIVGFQSVNLNFKFTANLIFGFGFSLLIAKILSSSIFVFEDIFRFIKYFINLIFSQDVKLISRNIVVGKISFVIATITFLAFYYGIIFGKYNYNVKNINLQVENLPKEFEKFRIVQISDMHLGSFDSKKQLQKAVNLVQTQNADIILFTGDMVNNSYNEAVPYIEIFKKLNAPFGKISILGNHDYALYIHHDNPNLRKNEVDKLIEVQKKMGFNLLRNENVVLQKGQDSIIIAGVENWGKPPFPQFGDLAKATAGLNGQFTILLSHDPSHWDEIIKNFDKKIELTLSGHTHGMQIGFDIFGFKWSPVKLKYPKWSGLYSENGKYLYVNVGFGFIGYPGRLGVSPEITVFELNSKKK